MQAGASVAPPKPWERAGRLPTAAPLPVTTGVAGAAAPAAAAAGAVGGAAAAATASAAASSTTPASVSAATGTSNLISPSSTSYGSSAYGGYGSSYGGMYGRSSMNGGYGGGMYGRSMYGGGMYGSSMYGGGMYGQRPGGQEAEFFAPKVPEEESQPSRLTELKELNASLLDSLHSYGDGFCGFARQLLQWMLQLRSSVRATGAAISVGSTGRVGGTGAAAATLFLGLLVLARAAALRRRRTSKAPAPVLWEALFAYAVPRLAAAQTGGPALLPAPSSTAANVTGMPWAAL